MRIPVSINQEVNQRTYFLGRKECYIGFYLLIFPPYFGTVDASIIEGFSKPSSLTGVFNVRLMGRWTLPFILLEGVSDSLILRGFLIKEIISL